ncbi:MAG TPA: DUF4340 domain-containing protein, partial [Mariprofundaceae bacterium]|nr:DUF4340 domain-containing protein [Mariprofundaceae bacterium]
LMRWAQPPEALQAMPAWPSVVPARAADIVLYAAGPASSRVHLVRRGKDWQVQDGKDWRDADGQAVDDMLGTLAGMRPDRMVTTNPDHYADLHVTDGADRITVKGETGAAMLDLLVGKPGPDLVSTYVRLAGRPEVLSVDRSLGWQVRRALADWLEKEPKAAGSAKPAPAAPDGKDTHKEAGR